MFAKYLFFTAVFMVGAVALAIPSGYSLGFYSLCFAGLGMWLKCRGPLVQDETRFFFLPLLVYAFGETAFALHENWRLRELATYLPFVLVLFGVSGIRRCRPNAEWFWAGLAVGAICAAVLSGYQAMVIGIRAGGHTHPIQFGNVALLFGVLCLVRALVGPPGWAIRLLMLAGYAAGLAASVWSQTRGGWVAVGLIFAWILFNATKGWTSFKRVLVALGALTFLVAPALWPDGVVQSRLNEAANELHAFYTQGKQDTSVGARLAMWSVAIDEIGNEPFFGHGNQGWIDVRDAAIAEGRLNGFSKGFTQLHNEYLNETFKRGLLGLALLLALYLVPMLMFFKPYLHDRRSEVRALAMAGMVVSMMYLDFGLTQASLSHNSGRIVLCSLWMCVAGLMLNALHVDKTQL